MIEPGDHRASSCLYNKILDVKIYVDRTLETSAARRFNFRVRMGAVRLLLDEMLFMPGNAEDWL
jgi:hypothetical protein